MADWKVERLIIRDQTNAFRFIVAGVNLNFKAGEYGHRFVWHLETDPRNDARYDVSEATVESYAEATCPGRCDNVVTR